MSLLVDSRQVPPLRSVKAAAVLGAGSVGRNSVRSTSIRRQDRRLLGPRKIMAPVAPRSKDSRKRPTAVEGIIVTVRSDGNKR